MQGCQENVRGQRQIKNVGFHYITSACEFGLWGLEACPRKFLRIRSTEVRVSSAVLYHCINILSVLKYLSNCCTYKGALTVLLEYYMLTLSLAIHGVIGIFSFVVVSVQDSVTKITIRHSVALMFLFFFSKSCHS